MVSDTRGGVVGDTRTRMGTGGSCPRYPGWGSGRQANAPRVSLGPWSRGSLGDQGNAGSNPAGSTGDGKLNREERQAVALVVGGSSPPHPSKEGKMKAWKVVEARTRDDPG